MNREKIHKKMRIFCLEIQLIFQVFLGKIHLIHIEACFHMLLVLYDSSKLLNYIFFAN